MIYIIIATILYTIALIFITLSARHADTNLATAITNIVSTILPVIIIIPYLNKKLVSDGKVGLIYAILGGIAIALYTLALTKSFATNKVAIVSPIIYGGSIFLTAIISFVLFKEKISLFQGIGLSLVGVGILFILYAIVTGK